jgi:cation:H+ antiporter
MPGITEVWIVNIVLLAGGLIVLGCGGECLVRGASQLARQMGVSALVVGLTVVAFGTSAPEIAVSMQSAYQGHDDLAVANAIGSCIMNILIVLALAALVCPLRVSRNVVTTDAPVMLFVTALFILFAVDNDSIERWEGLVFVGLLFLYTLFTYSEARRQPQIVEAEYEEELRVRPRAWPINALAVLIGITGLVTGADLIVDGATGIATLFGVSQRIIGLTIVALGTSLPELATCVIAARHKQPDIAIGNVVGSNIFNILAVIGVTAAFFPLSVAAEMIHFDVPVLLGTVVISFWVLRTGHQIARREGALLLGLYGVYLVWLLR